MPAISNSANRPIDLSRNGRRIVVTKNDGHPESYCWISIDEKLYFLCSIQTGWTRRDVKAAAEEWLKAHPQHMLGNDNTDGR